MRKNFVIFILLVFSSSLFAKNQSEEKAKMALHVASIARMSWSFNNELNLQPADFIKDSHGRIIGQNFHYPFQSRYYKIDLIWDGETPSGIIYNDVRTSDGKVGQDKGYLFWNGDNLQRVKVDYLNKFDYNIEQKGTSILITQNKIENSGLKIAYEAFFEGDKLKRIEKQLYKGSKKIINGIREYGYSDKTYSVHIVVSKYGKPLKPKFEYKNAECYYKELSANLFEIMGYQNGRVKQMYYAYNDIGQLISKKYPTFNNDDAEEIYSYIDNRLFQKTTIIKNGGNLLEKKILVYFDAPNQDETKPSYDNKQGKYEFDSNNELIYEAIDMKYRKKTNGVWSSWQQMRY
jgi:hypothetical protein